MLKFILFLTLIVALFQKQLWWLLLRLEDSDGWSCYLGIALSLFFLYKQEKENSVKKINFYHLSALLFTFCMTIHFLPHLIQCLLKIQ